MRILVTGLNGTLAPHIARALRVQNHEVLGWDRAAIDPDSDSAAIQQHLEALGIGGICHLAMGSEAWGAAMASFSAARDLPFVFTSTAMVFDASSGGPHRVRDARTARDDYGRYKIRCEDAILAANPQAAIARIGYQIDWESPSGNNMVAHLMDQAAQGPIRASEAWIPATSLMRDTAQGIANLLALAQQGAGAGVHHLDSNAADAWSYPQIVEGVRQKLGASWQVVTTREYAHDQRLLPDDTGTAVAALPPLSQAF